MSRSLSDLYRYHAAANTSLSWGLVAGLVASFTGWQPALTAFFVAYLAVVSLTVWSFERVDES